MAADYIDPRYVELIDLYDLTELRAVQRNAPACGNCHRTGHVFMVDLTTKKPFTAACLVCNPGGT